MREPTDVRPATAAEKRKAMKVRGANGYVDKPPIRKPKRKRVKR